MSINKRFANFGENVLMRYKYVFFIFFILLIYFSVLGLKKIKIDNSYKAMLEPDHPIRLNNDYYKELFGNNDYIYILVEAENTLNPEVLKQIDTLSKSIKEELPFVEEVTSFTDVEYLEVDNDYIIAGDLIEDNIPETDSALNELRKKVLAKNIYLNRLTNKSLTQTGIFVRFKEFPDSVYVPKNNSKSVFFKNDIIIPQQKNPDSTIMAEGLKLIKDPLLLIAPATYRILDSNSNKYCTYTATGSPLITYNVHTILQKESARSFAIALIIVVIILSLIYRSFRSVLLPVFIILTSVIITFGMIGWLNIIVTTFALVIALLVLVISVGYSIHVINHFRKSFFYDGDRKKAVKNIYENAGWPCFVTALTTIIGFSSFTVVDMIPVRNLGIAGAIGVFVTFVLVIFLLPAAFSFGKDKVIHGAEDNNRITTPVENHRFMSWLAFLPFRHEKIIISITLIVIIASIFSILNIKADTDFINLFGDKNEFVRDARHSTENLGSLYSYEVLIELPEPEMVKEPEVLLALENLNELIKSLPTTKFTLSVNDLIKDINQTMQEGDTNYYNIPKQRDLIAQYFLLYEMAGGDNLEQWVDYDYQRLRQSVRINRSTTDLKYDFKKIKNYCATVFPKGTQVSIAGDMSIFLRAVSYLTNDQAMSIIFAFIGILLALIITLKRIKLALLAMIPNVVPVLIIMGLMAPLGITLNLQTIVAAPVIMGLAVDDTVHYFIRIKNDFMKERSYIMANKVTLLKIGWALVNTSFILLIGFLTFFFTKVNSLKSISILLMAGVISALLADLIVAPVLLKVFKTFGKEE